MKLIYSTLRSFIALLSIMSLLLILQESQAQTKNGLKLLKSSNLDGAFSEFQKDLNTDIAKIAAKYNIGKIYADEAFSNHNLDSAYHYLTAAAADKKKLKADNRKKLEKIDEGVRYMKKLTRDVAKSAGAQADEAGSVAAYNHFLSYYEGADRVLESKMSKARNALAFKEAKEINTTQAYEDFVVTYRKSLSKYTPGIFKKAQRKHFEHYIRDKSWSGYDAFAEKFKYNVYVRDSLKDLFHQARKYNTLNAYKGFADANPDSPYAKIAADSMAAIIGKGGSLNDYEVFLMAHPKHEASSDMWMTFYKKFLQENGKDKMKLFKYTYEDFPHGEMLDKQLNAQHAKSEEEEWRIANSKRTFESYHDFINLFQMSDKMLEAQDGMQRAIVKDSILSQHSYFVENFPNNAETPSMWMRFYGMYKDQNGEDSVIRFARDYPEFPDPKLLEKEKTEAIARVRAKKKAKATAGKK